MQASCEPQLCIWEARLGRAHAASRQGHPMQARSRRVQRRGIAGTLPPELKCIMLRAADGYPVPQFMTPTYLFDDR